MKFRNKMTKKMMEEDADYAGGDDDAMRLLMHGYSGQRFLDAHAAAAMHNNEGMSRETAYQNARVALATAQTSFGANAGTHAMRAAAAKAYKKSNTAYRYATDEIGRRQFVVARDANGNPLTNPDGTPIYQRDAQGNRVAVEMDYAQMATTAYGDSGRLVAEGVMTANDAAVADKSNGSRAERAGLGHGTTQGTVSSIAEALQRGQTVESVLTPTRLRAMADEVVSGTNPQQLWAGRHESVRILAPEMLRRSREAAERDGGLLSREFVEQLAASASLQDAAGQNSQLNAALAANNFMGQTIGDPARGGRTQQQWLDFIRGPIDENDPTFQHIYQNEVQRIQQQLGGQQGPPTAQQHAAAVRNTRIRIQTAQNTLQQYRREYSNAWQQPGQPQQGP
jgi:hypothetical protein